MYYHINKEQENYLVSQPETGMGYQLIEAATDEYSARKKYLVLNSEIAIDLDGSQNLYVRRVMIEGILKSKSLSAPIRLNQIRVLQKTEYSNLLNESKGNSKGAKRKSKRICQRC